APAQERMDLELDLRNAVARGEFILHYQPILELPTGRIVEMEALVRWKHPQRGLLFPGDFVGLSEETGLIVPLGRWCSTRPAARLASGSSPRRDPPWRSA